MSAKPPLVIVGPVKSGKTSELIRELHRHDTRRTPVIVVKHAIDAREHDRAGLIRSRDGTQYPSTVIVDTLDYASIVGAHERPVVVAIDEGQFFGDSLVPFVKECMRNGHQVVLSALNADFCLLPFDCIARVSAFAVVRQLFAICSDCGADALHSKKLGGDLSVQIEVDGPSVTYEPVCTSCLFFKK
jgi:thymidine kinase